MEVSCGLGWADRVPTSGWRDPTGAKAAVTVLRTIFSGITIEVMRTISLKLPDDLLAELEREAKARRVTKSDLVRQSLATALRRRPRQRTDSCYDLARDLAGSLKGLPRDLASNPKYMDGFGE